MVVEVVVMSGILKSTLDSTATPPTAVEWLSFRTLREAAIVTRGTACGSWCLKFGSDDRSFSGSGVDIIGSLFAPSPTWTRHDDTRH